MRVTIDARKLNRSMNRVLSHLRNPQVFYREAAIHMREYVRGTIRIQGRKRKYASLAPMTRQKTGRRKALITLTSRIKSGATRDKGIVYFDPISSRWHIDDHHKGFTTGPVAGKKMSFSTRSGKIAFTARKTIRVPAREVWPTKAEVELELRPIAKKWVDRGIKKF